MSGVITGVCAPAGAAAISAHAERTPRAKDFKAVDRFLGARERALEEDGAVRGAEFRLEGPVRVRHQAQDIAPAAHDAGYAARRAVGIVEVAEHHLAFAFQPVEGGLVGEEIALAV